MQKKILILLFVVGLTIFILQPAYAQMGMMELDSNQQSQEESDTHGEQIDEVLENVLANHSAITISELDCDEVTDDEFERLGEASMSLMHPDPEVHERMDQMMGGEGSETLRSAHINMGSQYLGCSLGKGGMDMMTSGGITGMGGMMGSNGNYSFSGFGGIFLFFWLTIWALIIILLLVLIRYFWKKGSEKK